MNRELLNENISAGVKGQFTETIEDLKETAFNREEKLKKLVSQIDVITRKKNGVAFIYDNIEKLLEINFFEGTVWEHSNELIPSLVGGTLMADLPNNVLEIVSELRVLKIATGAIHADKLTKEEAIAFLEDIIVLNFELVFKEDVEKSTYPVSKKESQRIKRLFDFIMQTIPLDNIKRKLGEDVVDISEQRPISTAKIEEILKLAREHFLLSREKENEAKLLYYSEALFYPTEYAKKHVNTDDYLVFIKTCDKRTLLDECKSIAEKMNKTGLVSPHQLELLKYLSEEFPKLVPVLLGMDSHGKAEYEKHSTFVNLLIKQFITFNNKEVVYGLKMLLERNLFSRAPVWNAFNKLIRLEIHPKVKKNLLKNAKAADITPGQLLVGGTISVLGQPLGVGQGLNPTCQSARGISMWSQHSPAKLLNMIIEAATSNNMSFRYEGELIESSALLDGLTKKFDFNLDPVSIALVPHLDKIYNDMMKRATIKHIGQDPHVSVNPAFYGHWIHTGFASAYNNLLLAIVDYDQFVRIFFASFHPSFNNGNDMVYPVPVGIFITSSKGEMAGFHAISLLRVAQDETKTWRAYFYNPNNEGRQNWGQNIKPSVARNGEQHGESSLPFEEFASRIYAFHYNTHDIKAKLKQVDPEPIKKVTTLAKESWGKKYRWIEN